MKTGDTISFGGTIGKIVSSISPEGTALVEIDGRRRELFLGPSVHGPGPVVVDPDQGTLF